ncbi:helix-turn-helix transcriptional regulator [Paenibacillus physcomitrellae]|uniref:AraC family transcriptional regulator n=1 Tax=Paenibacillus physcomitrellae TaxID=1619311 RepID=A0ABQ1FS58_9BACL|nr:AraC family transcriptional regulator [Paenibacillus physcomitrellae]GGA27088.1 AraC family transcriptional regulator [Paenibacillus physcomitrellae]
MTNSCRRQTSVSFHFVLPMPMMMLKAIGWEMVTSHEYVWDGRNRPGDHCILQITLAGRGEIELNGRKHVLEPGHVFLVDVPGSHVYRLPESSSSWELLYVELSHDALGFWKELIAAEGPVVRIGLDSAFMKLMWRIYDEAVQDRYKDIYQCSEAAYSIVMQLASLFESRRGNRRLPAAVEKCKLFIEERFSEPVGLDEMAQAAGCSKYHLTRECERTLGATPGRYLTMVRLERASVLLLSPEAWTLEEVAAMTGFSNANYFGKVFRRHTGMSPGEFRHGSDLYEIRRMLFPS